MKNYELTPKYVFFMTIFLYILCNGLSVGIASIIAGYLDEKDASTAIFLIIILMMIIFCPIVINLLKRSGLWKIKKNLVKCEIKYIFIGFVGVCLVSLCLGGIIEVFHIELGNVEGLSHWDRVSEKANKIIVLIGTVIAAPMYEEVFFRGVLFGAIRAKKGFALAAIVSSILFGLGHGVGWYTVVGFLLGAILCLVYEATRNIVVPIAVHMLNNGMANSGKLNDSVKIPYFDNMYIDLPILIILMGASVLVFVLLIKKARQKTQNEWI